ncbi:MAG: hypothetical protein II998_12840 [Clostridia bacterium]|nr:hypothetical protein [Clostridia bacterium]
MICEKCGKKVSGKRSKCESCGYPVTLEDAGAFDIKIECSGSMSGMMPAPAAVNSSPLPEPPKKPGMILIIAIVSLSLIMGWFANSMIMGDSVSEKKEKTAQGTQDKTVFPEPRKEDANNWDSIIISDNADGYYLVSKADEEKGLQIGIWRVVDEAGNGEWHSELNGNYAFLNAGEFAAVASEDAENQQSEEGGAEEENTKTVQAIEISNPKAGGDDKGIVDSKGNDSKENDSKGNDSKGNDGKGNDGKDKEASSDSIKIYDATLEKLRENIMYIGDGVFAVSPHGPMTKIDGWIEIPGYEEENRRNTDNPEDSEEKPEDVQIAYECYIISGGQSERRMNSDKISCFAEGYMINYSTQNKLFFVYNNDCKVVGMLELSDEIKDAELARYGKYLVADSCIYDLSTCQEAKDIEFESVAVDESGNLVVTFKLPVPEAPADDSDKIPSDDNKKEESAESDGENNDNNATGFIPSYF